MHNFFIFILFYIFFNIPFSYSKSISIFKSYIFYIFKNYIYIKTIDFRKLFIFLYIIILYLYLKIYMFKSYIHNFYICIQKNDIYI